MPEPAEPAEEIPPLDESGRRLASLRLKTVKMKKKIRFEFNKWAIDPRSHKLLSGVALALLSDRSFPVCIIGHVDSKGSASYNKTLTQKRADSVKAYLYVLGIQGGRMTTIGAGESEPIADNSTPEGRAKNRRMEIRACGS